jgi:predicted dehydrogenase
MNPLQPVTRRSFLRKTAAAATGSIFVPNILISQEGGGKKVNVAGIGAGGKGEVDLAYSAMGANIVAITEVDHDRMKAAAAKYPDAKVFDNFPEMFEAMADKIDMVTVTTPDHAHYPAAMEAIKRGKHVCVQKPLVNRIWEANQLHEAAKKKGVKTNMGNQGHTGEQIRQLKEWMQAGIVGNVKEIHVWTNRPIWPQGNEASQKMQPGPLPTVKAGPKGQEVSKTLDLNWTAWLAACPDVPFTNGLHPFSWRGHREYGAGAMGDMGCHLMDGPFFSCELGEPYKMEAEVEELTDISWPKSSHVICYFKHPKFGEVKLHWYEGGRKPERPAKLEESRNWDKMNGGFIIVGEEDSILNVGDYCEHLEVIGNREKLVKFAQETPKTLERSLAPDNPQLELIRSIEQGKVCGSNFDYSVPLTKLCLFGNLAILNPGKVINWDTAKQSTGDAEVDKLLKRAAYRQGWEYSADKV